LLSLNREQVCSKNKQVINMEIALQKIVVKSNPRTDFGNID